MRIFAALMGVIFSATAFAAEPAAPSMLIPYLEGRDYVVMEKPVPTSTPGKVEVVEVFSYLCPHCYHFDPILAAWMKQQKPDVALVQIHASWSPAMEPYQRGFYTLEALKIKEKAHAAVFDAIHKSQKEFKDAQAWADFLAPYGVKKEAVIATYNSDAITKQLARSGELFRSYQISGTPEMVVDGKYRISTRFTGSQEDMLKVVQFLVNKARAERGAK